MKIRRFLLLLQFLPALVLAQPAEPVPADRVVAVVNSEAITGYDLKQRVTIVLQQMRTQNIQPPAQDVLVKQVLERLIMDRLQLQYAKETGLTVSDADLEATLRRIAEGNNVWVSDMRASIEKDGMDWERFRNDIREQVIVTR